MCVFEVGGGGGEWKSDVGGDVGDQATASSVSGSGVLHVEGEEAETGLGCVLGCSCFISRVSSLTRGV